MCRESYGLLEEPFALDPDPRFLHMTPTHFEAYFSIMSGIKDKKGIIVITGEVGTGKTLILHAILKDLGDRIKTAFIFHPGLSLKDLLKEILVQLDVPLRKGEHDLAYFLTAFRGYLNERLARDEIVAVIIDEAQNLDEETLEGIGRFCDLEAPVGRVLQILLAGHPALEEKLDSKILRLFKQRTKVHCRIAPLDLEEGRRYIEHRLKVAGRNPTGIFTPYAAYRIVEFAQGIPRVINLVCERALQAGSKKSSPVIGWQIASEAMQELGYLSPDEVSTLWQSLSLRKSNKVFRIFLLLLSIALFIFSVRQLMAVLLHR